MNRLTHKYEDGSGYTPVEHHDCCNVTLYDFNVDDYDRCVDKLGRLEDLQEELGCPLEVVFKALDVGVCVNCKVLNLEEYDTIERPRLYYSDDNKCYCFESLFGGYVVKLKDYQKTWWLKGEKENE